jgi:quercetin dioxygenase-like cupin family protein
MYYKARPEFKYEPKPDRCKMCGEGRLCDLANVPASPNMRAIFVEFQPGAYTKSHWHEGTQFLYGTEGTGFVELEGVDDLEITEGTRVLILAGVWYRHGATPEECLVHLAVTVGKTHWEYDSECDKYRESKS